MVAPSVPSVAASPSPLVAPAPGGTPASIRVAVIVPAYKQPGLLVEALSSALRQELTVPYAVLVVNDGCPWQETEDVCREFARLHPGRLYYLHRANGGLSAARNAGIEHALRWFPALEAVYFLDSDNRLYPRTLQRLYQELMRPQDAAGRAPGGVIGWAYPDIDKFGLREYGDMRGAYNPLEHTFRNVSEAGSMAHRRLLDTGARFDTSMRLGYEDWEFWLQGLSHGLRGQYVKTPGFRYRKRGESMLQSSIRHNDAIMAYMYAKHRAKLYAPARLLEMEEWHAPRYAVITPETGQVHLGNDPANPRRSIPVGVLHQRLFRTVLFPDYGQCPGYVAVIPERVLRILQRAGLLAGVLWQMERLLATTALCRAAVHLHTVPTPDAPGQAGALSVRWQQSEMLIGPRDTVTPDPRATDSILMVSAALITGVTLVSPAPTLTDLVHYSRMQRISQIDLHVTMAAEATETEPSGCQTPRMETWLRNWAQAWRSPVWRPWRETAHTLHRAAYPSPRQYYGTALEVPSILPLPRTVPAHSGAVPEGSGAPLALALVVGGRPGDPVPLAQVQLACALAEALLKALHQSGEAVDCHLMVLGAMAVRLPTPHPFTSVNLIPCGDAHGRHHEAAGKDYLGAPLYAFQGPEVAYATGCALGCAMAVNLMSPLAHELVGSWRTHGVPTLGLLPCNAVSGTLPASTVLGQYAAYEHVYEHFFCLHPTVEPQAVAAGLPRIKFWRDPADAPVGGIPQEDSGGTDSTVLQSLVRCVLSRLGRQL